MSTSRVVALIDMDCFYCQVEERADPSLRGVPAAVVQYNSWKGGGIIAVNYEARASGVARNMRGDEAKAKCPDIRLVSVPEHREKADLTKYRNAGKEVIAALLEFSGAVVERASVDEAYVDLTAIVERTMSELDSADLLLRRLPHTFISGYDSGDRETGLREWIAKARESPSGASECTLRLAVGAAVVEEMRAAVLLKTEFRCSAGIAHNKMLAKLACGLHKPNKQTVLPQDQVNQLFATLPVSKLRGLGGKLGDAVAEELNCATVGDLAAVPLATLRKHFDEKTSAWLFGVAKGENDEPVKERDLPKTIGCSKNFLGPKMLDTREQVIFWLGQLSAEVCERLEVDRASNGRTARGLVVSVGLEGRTSVSRHGVLPAYDAERIASSALQLISRLNEAKSDQNGVWRPKLTNLSVGALRFEQQADGTASVQSFFAKSDSSTVAKSKEDDLDRMAAELVPDVDNFDESLLDVLPTKLKERVLFRVNQVRSEAGSSKTKDESIQPCLPTEPETREHKSDLSEELVRQAAELVPDLGSFQEDLLPLLRPKLRAKVAERVADLKTKAANSQAEEDACSRCGKKVSPFDLPEHLDFHVAQDLQRELRKSEMAAGAASISAPQAAAVAEKRKLPTTEDGATNAKKQSNIRGFFARK